jgi:hypothetical protein
LEEV